MGKEDKRSARVYGQWALVCTRGGYIKVIQPLFTPEAPKQLVKTLF